MTRSQRVRDKLLKRMSDLWMMAGAALATLALGGFLALSIGFAPDWMLYIILLYPIGLAIIAIGDGISIGFHPLGIAGIFVLRFILSLWDLLSILLFVPFLVMHMIMGPFMILLFIVCAVMIGIDIIEWLGLDLEGIRASESLSQFLITLGAMVISGGVIYWMFFRDEVEEDPFTDAGTRLIHGLPDKMMAGIDVIKAHYGPT